MLREISTTTCAALCGALGIASAAQAQHVDGLIFQDGGAVRTGAIDVECFQGVGPPGCDPNGFLQRVYEAELAGQGAGPVVGFADEPGFFAVPQGSDGNLPFGTPLPGNAAHTIDIILAPNSPVSGASILFWDGAGAVSWSAVPSAEYLEILGNGGSGGILDGSNQVLGVGLDPTAADGSFDTHPDFLLHGAGGVSDPTIGFYTIFGRTHIAGLDASDPWAVVFDFGVEDEELHELAVESVAGFIPEPTTGALLGLGLVGLGMGGRRRRVR